MSDDKKPEVELDLDVQIEREDSAITKLNAIIGEFNTHEFKDYPHIEEGLLFYLVTRMAASANGETGKEHFTRDHLLRMTKAAINAGKDVIEQGRQDGTLPRPFNLIKPKGLH